MCTAIFRLAQTYQYETESKTNLEKQIFSDFIDKYRDAEMVVIGIGEEWNAYLEKQEYQDLLAFYAPYLEKKNYFCITSSRKMTFHGEV